MNKEEILEKWKKEKEVLQTELNTELEAEEKNYYAIAAFATARDRLGFCITDLETAAFKQSPSTLQWIKASERLPEKPEKARFRNIEQGLEIKAPFKKIDGNMIEFDSGVEGVLFHTYIENIEWLSESPLSTASPSEFNAATKTQIEQLMYFIEGDGTPVDGYRFREIAKSLKEKFTSTPSDAVKEDAVADWDKIFTEAPVRIHPKTEEYLKERLQEHLK